MISDLHFIRPLWFLMFIPLVALAFYLYRQGPVMHSWAAVCDEHLLSHLLRHKGTQSKRLITLLVLFGCAGFIIISLSGPTWSRLPVPTYQQVQPRVIVLDMSSTMLEKDIQPDRLSRAKFKLHDLFSYPNAGQFGLVVYSGEPFIVSPLTDDAQTIDTLVRSLTYDIIPVNGQRLDLALEQAATLITQAGFNHGDILVMTAEPPTSLSIETARILAKKGINTSVIPMLATAEKSVDFQRLATNGHGDLILLTDTSADLENWLTGTDDNQGFRVNEQQEASVWVDQGRWFLIPALLCLLPVFRRGWLQRINT